VPYDECDPVWSAPIEADDAARIASAVVANARADLFTRSPAGINRPGWLAAIRADAWAFFTEADGDWAGAREAWCDAAGLNADVVRAQVHAKKLNREWPEREMAA
jgi:hypothetical protein